MRSGAAFVHGIRLHGRHHGIKIEIKAWREVFRGLHAELALTVKAFVGQIDLMMETSFTTVHRIIGVASIANDVLEAERMVVHHHQRLDDVWKDATRHQPTLKCDIGTIEVIEALHGEWLQAIIELTH